METKCFQAGNYSGEKLRENETSSDAVISEMKIENMLIFFM